MRWEYQTTLPAFWEACMQVKKQQLELDTEQQTGSRLVKEYVVCQVWILSPCLFNLHAVYIMWNIRLDEAQAGIKTARRNSNNLRYADDTTLMAESKEELKSLLMRVKEESENAGLKLSILKTKIMASGSPVNRWEKNGNSDRIFFGVPKSSWTVIAAMKFKNTCSLEEKLWQT